MLTENKKIVVESSNLLGGVAVFVTSRKKNTLMGSINISSNEVMVQSQI